ncbi:ShTK domain protein [Trichostrongylus colubriformis]|uniref:ShTK domain protein n=1 Tax=Trichostrongylus colubriformis TaxID=6319 RepID=A0AAN8FQV4_TRICO
MLLHTVLFLLALTSSTTAATCPDGQTSVGPCTPDCPADTECNQDLQECCPVTNITVSINSTVVVPVIPSLSPQPVTGMPPRTGVCVDKPNPKTNFSDCFFRRHLCNEPIYQAVMTEQCPKTCNRCSAITPTRPKTSVCADLPNPKTKVSDCALRKEFCNDPNYRNVMSEQCNKTCGLCNGRNSFTPAPQLPNLPNNG